MIKLNKEIIPFLPNEMIIEILSFVKDKETLFITIPLVCKRFNEVLYNCLKKKIIIRDCEKCFEIMKSIKKRLKITFGLKKVYDDEHQELIFCCEECRYKCRKCDRWTITEKYCSTCYKYICLQNSAVCHGCKSRDCINHMKRKSLLYFCKNCYVDASVLI